MPSVFVIKFVVAFSENGSFIAQAPESGFRITPDWPQINKTTVKSICRHDVIVKFFDVVLFLLSRLVTGSSFMSISLLVLELWVFFYKGLTRNLEIPPSEFCPISGDWCELGIPNLARMFLQNVPECCKMPGLQLLPFLSY